MWSINFLEIVPMLNYNLLLVSAIRHGAEALRKLRAKVLEMDAEPAARTNRRRAAVARARKLGLLATASELAEAEETDMFLLVIEEISRAEEQERQQPILGFF